MIEDLLWWLAWIVFLAPIIVTLVIISLGMMTEELLLPLNGAILLGEILACIVCAILEYLLTNGRRNDG